MRFSLLAALMLAGCAGHQHIETRIQTVYCLTPAQYKELVDAEPAKIGHSLDPDARKSNKQLVTQNVLVRQYADGLLDVLGHCVG